jgi:hypothetical protein
MQIKDKAKETEALKAQEKETLKREKEEKNAKEKADKEAKIKADKEAEEKSKHEYLDKLTAGTTLRARKCPDGEGKYYTVGLLPKIKPAVVGCVDVNFKATCPGDAVGSVGKIKNFQGVATDCFMGDTEAISPKPSCPVAQVQVQVLSVVPGCN